MTYLDPAIKRALLEDWLRAGADPDRPSSRQSHAEARASWLQELIYVLYDETKFRLLDGEERASLGWVSDAIESHRERMATRALGQRR